MVDEPQFRTAAEVADLLRLHPQVVQRKLQSGEIPGYKIGREWRVEHGQLMEWLERYSNQRTRPLTDRWFAPDGSLRAMPTQRAKRTAVLARLAERFEAGRDYPERQVNDLLRPAWADVAFVRREMVAEGLLTRSRGVYRRPAD